MNTLRVVLVDDHNLVRAGLRSLLEDIAGVKVLAEAADGREALALVRQHRPDLVVMDVIMDQLNGLEATDAIKRALPDTQVLILSMYASPDFITHALRAGASGYILKDAATPELELAIRAVMRGEVYLSPAVSKRVVEGYLGARPADGQSVGGALTQRQREILKLLAEGNGTKEIAFRLQLSPKTVDAHRAKIMARLDIRDLPGLVRYAIRVGLVSVANER